MTVSRAPELIQSSGLVNLEVALLSFIERSDLVGSLIPVLAAACCTSRISFEAVEVLAGNFTEDALLQAWEWRLMIPVRTVRCHEWDDRILVVQRGETYEMPNVSRIMVKNALESGEWDASRAIADFFERGGEPSWDLMPRLVRRLREGYPARGISARQIRTACREMGLSDRTDTMIAILKGSGVLSPKLGSLSQVARHGTPLYELNPCLFPKPGKTWCGGRIDGQG